MDATSLPIFDFHAPWVALIQLALLFVLPQLVGLVTDKLTDARIKVTLLGILTLVATALTWLLDVAIADAWATADWTSLVNVIVTAGITWALANGIFKGVLVPIGATAAAQKNDTIQLFGPSE